MLRKLWLNSVAMSVAVCLGLLGLLLAGVDGEYVLRNGGGNEGGGSSVATVAVFSYHGSVGIGWTHSDVWFEDEFSVRTWIALLIAVALPACYVVQRIRRRRHRAAGCCPQCGYDLRASPTRCPECGTAVVPGDQATA